MEASVFEAPVGLARGRVAIGAPLLRLRSDEQLVELFRNGHDEAFRVIHDRYRKRLLAYVRQMLPRRPDAEDALQEVFVRAYFGLRAHDRELSLRAWLFRIAHNRCIDELRRPAPPPPEIMEMLRSTVQDPVAEAERRESLRRLIADVRRLPGQQRSALLMRELGGMSYSDLAASLDVSVPAVKSLLVRARVGLARAAEARDTACSEIREALVEAHDSGVRPGAMARRHMHDCSGCRSFRRELRGMSRGLAAIAPTFGGVGLLAKLLGGSGTASGGSGGASTGACGLGSASGSSAAVGGAVSAGGTASSAGIAIGANHVAALIAAAVATGGAVAIPNALVPALQTARSAASSHASAAQPAASTAQMVVATPSGQVIVVPASLAPAPANTPTPSSGAHAKSHQSSHPASSASATGAVTGGSASVAQTLAGPDDTNPSASSGPSGSTSTTSAAPGSVVGTGSIVAPGASSTGTSSGSTSGSQPSGSSTGSPTSLSGTTSSGSGSSSGSSGSGVGSSTGTGTSGSTSSSSGSTSGSTGSTSSSGTASDSGTGTSSSGSATK